MKAHRRISGLSIDTPFFKNSYWENNNFCKKWNFPKWKKWNFNKQIGKHTSNLKSTVGMAEIVLVLKRLKN